MRCHMTQAIVRKPRNQCMTLSPGHTYLATGRQPPCDQNFGWSQRGCRVVARRSLTGRRPDAEGCRDNLVARRFWLLQVKPLCDQIDHRKVFDGHRQVGDWSRTSCSGCRQSRQFLVADWSPTSRRSVADRSPKSCRVSAIKNKRSRYSRQPVTNRSPIGCQSLPNWSPTGRQLLSDYTTL